MSQELASAQAVGKQVAFTLPPKPRSQAVGSVGDHYRLNTEPLDPFKKPEVFARAKACLFFERHLRNESSGLVVLR